MLYGHVLCGCPRSFFNERRGSVWIAMGESDTTDTAGRSVNTMGAAPFVDHLSLSFRERGKSGLSGTYLEPQYV